MQNSSNVVQVDAKVPDPQIIARAAEILQRGGLIVFPTETVYGLGAVATDEAAVRRIFEAKGRPSNNPIIVHVPTAEAACQLVSEWPPEAERLASEFWPGPLTLVLRKSGLVPNIVTASGPNVAVRIPRDTVALALLQATGKPIAAPSANRSTELSPTRAEHVARSLGSAAEMILDAGPCEAGIESTVLALGEAALHLSIHLEGGVATRFLLLRPGAVSRDELERVLGGPIAVYQPAAAEIEASPEPLTSPGTMARHYAPRTRLILADLDGAEEVRSSSISHQKIAWLRFAPATAEDQQAGVRIIMMPQSAAEYASRLFETLHQIDNAGQHDVIVVQRPPHGVEWEAVLDRLTRAAHPE